MAADLQKKLDRRTSELARTRKLHKDTLQQQNATSEVLQVISSSPAELTPVFDAMLKRAMRLCEAAFGGLWTFEGERYVAKALCGVPPAYASYLRHTNLVPGPHTAPYRFRKGERSAIQNIDLAAEEAYLTGDPQRRALVDLGGARAALQVPLVRDEVVLGVITVYRQEAKPFSEEHARLLQNFAAQAVIAIENTRLFNEVQAKTRDLEESLQQQTATADVLKVISRSAFDLQTVLDTLVESAYRLCGANLGLLYLKADEAFECRAIAGLGVEEASRYFKGRPIRAGRATAAERVIATGEVQSITDFFSDPDFDPGAKEVIRNAAGTGLGVLRSTLAVPMTRDDFVIGVLVIASPRTGPFPSRQVELLQTFADQAVIAIQNARLFNETKEALERQTATADILKVIANSPSDTTPAFEAIAGSAKRLLPGVRGASVFGFRDGIVYLAASTNPTAVESLKRDFPMPVAQFEPFELAQLGRPFPIADIEETPYAGIQRNARLHGFRSMLFVPLMNGGLPIGVISVTRAEPGAFAPDHIQLLQTFADQAVIAIQNTRLFNETREALERQTATADILKVIASSPDDVQPVFQAIADQSRSLLNGLATAVYSFVGDVAHLMSYTPVSPEADAHLKARFPVALADVMWGDPIRKGEIFRVVDTEDGTVTSRMRDMGRTRGFRSVVFVPLLSDRKPIGAISVTRGEPGSFVDHHVEILRTFADQAVIAISNVRLFEQVQERTLELSQSLDDLRAAQDRLVQTEKLASLGQLTAGIAHEIKNPLNFVNNFSALSVELTDELNGVLKQATLADKIRAEVDELTGLLKDNLDKVVQHGKRADSIVKNMLLHSREGSGERRSADINALVGESLNLAYHGARAEKAGFTITLKHDLDPEAGALDLYPQEMTRALLNLISNGFYAATKRKVEASDGTFEPVISAATRSFGKTVEIRIRDNGGGIPPEVREKMFNPFFTTKPTGEGTGLGLSMTHDIIVKQHGGRIDVETRPGEFTEFIITLPR